MDSAELKERVRELRAEGRSPKEIARALKVPPSAVAPLVRAIAAEGAGGDGREGELVGCWMSVGWSNGLGVDPGRGWVDEAPESDGGMVSVLVARRQTWDRMAVVGCLADVYCTGIKNIIGHLGTDVFPRVKVGVGAPSHPDYDMVDWVIGSFSAQEKKIVDEALDHALDAAECIISRGVTEAQNRFN